MQAGDTCNTCNTSINTQLSFCCPPAHPPHTHLHTVEHARTHVHARAHACTQAQTCMDTCTYAGTHVHGHTHTPRHISTYVHGHTHTRRHAILCPCAPPPPPQGAYLKDTPRLNPEGLCSPPPLPPGLTLKDYLEGKEGRHKELVARMFADQKKTRGYPEDYLVGRGGEGGGQKAHHSALVYMCVYVAGGGGGVDPHCGQGVEHSPASSLACPLLPHAPTPAPASAHEHFDCAAALSLHVLLPYPCMQADNMNNTALNQAINDGSKTLKLNVPPGMKQISKGDQVG